MWELITRNSCYGDSRTAYVSTSFCSPTVLYGDKITYWIFDFLSVFWFFTTKCIARSGGGGNKFRLSGSLNKAFQKFLPWLNCFEFQLIFLESHISGSVNHFRKTVWDLLLYLISQKNLNNWPCGLSCWSRLVMGILQLKFGFFPTPNQNSLL